MLCNAVWVATEITEMLSTEDDPFFVLLNESGDPLE